ncbi:PilZ domain-containing protein [Pseudomonas sp. LRF_L74]|uniref:PilZ domain-containing protein n=1 Tax=Pseudomonas sp. LRF_L74 TaxID=3369422 RepID=UPI003F5D603D
MNKRLHVRSPMKVQLRIDHPVHGQVMVTTRDISDTGVYILLDEAKNLLKVDEIVSGQVQGLPIEAPILRMVVVRTEAMGVGLRFIEA